MILDKNIVKEGIKSLREKSIKVELPISSEDLNTLDNMLEYLKTSQDPELSKKYNITPGVGLAAPQIGINKRMFAIMEDEFTYGIINPEIIKESRQLIYLSGGEGCLSCPGKSGEVKRHKKIEVSCLLYNPETKNVSEERIKLEDYLAIVFQHEYDHLNGVLFIDKVTTNLNDAEAI